MSFVLVGRTEEPSVWGIIRQTCVAAAAAGGRPCASKGAKAPGLSLAKLTPRFRTGWQPQVVGARERDPPLSVPTSIPAMFTRIGPESVAFLFRRATVVSQGARQLSRIRASSRIAPTKILR